MLFFSIFRTSPVWAHFGFVPNEQGEPANLDEAACKMCAKKVPASRGNTSNLRRHLAKDHPATEAKLPPATTSTASKLAGGSRQVGVAGAFGRVPKCSRHSARHRSLTSAVTRYLVDEMVPFRTVEKQSFKYMIQKLDKQYELPGKTYFSETAVPKMCNELKVIVESEIKDVDFFSATTDMWSSITMHPYMSLTVHFVNKDWILKSRCLETSFLPVNHTADNIAEALKIILLLLSLLLLCLCCPFALM